jgi:DNA polymerase-1
VQLDLAGSHFGDYDREAVVQIFRQLEFRSLLGRLPGPKAAGREEKAGPFRQLSLFEEVAQEQPPPPAQPAANYRTVRDAAGLQAMLAALGRGPFAFDTETTALQPMEAELVGISLAIPGGQAWYIPLSHRGADGKLLRGQMSWDEVRPKLASLLGDPAVPKYAHHAKYDTLVLAEHGLEVGGLAFDTLIAAHLASGRSGLPGEGGEEGGQATSRRGDRSIGLKSLAFRLLGVEMREISELLGKGKAQRTMDYVPIEEAGPYACADADMTCRLQSVLAPQLAERGLQSLFADVEMPLVEVLREMERAGVALDVVFLQEMSRSLQQSLQEQEEKIYQAAGYPFNINSPQQLSEVLFHKLGLPLSATSKLKSGIYSTASDVLERLRQQHPVVEAILNQRELAKLKSTYLDTLPLLVNRRTGRLHTSFNQTATSTGRLSSSDPNLQNIPIRTELGRQVRRAFVADPGWVLLSADYSQVELRILAHLAQDPGLLEAFARGEDIHASTAATLFGVPSDQVNAEQRRVAKTVNFGLMYGMSEYGLAARLGIDQDIAARFIATYFGRYAGVKRYIEETLRQGRERGYVATVLGRRRYIPELGSPNRNVRSAAEREAINMPIQGTAADIIKIAMVQLHRALGERNLRSRMILQVHDELVLEVPQEEVGTVVPMVKRYMEGAYRLDAPLRVDAHTGPTWGDLKS